MTIYGCEAGDPPTCAKCDQSVSVDALSDWYQGQDICNSCAHERVAELEKLLRQCERHCVCSRNTNGFDYGETHRKLGKPRVGARWWTVTDIVKEAGITAKHAIVPEDK